MFLKILTSSLILLTPLISIFTLGVYLAEMNIFQGRILYMLGILSGLFAVTYINLLNLFRKLYLDKIKA